MLNQVDLSHKNKNRTRNEYCVSSKCEDGFHVLFWDFDNIEIYFVERSLSQVQHFHQLGDIYIIKTRNGYNAICLDKFFLNEAYNILFFTRWNDFNHIRVGFKGESWALKISPEKNIINRIIPTEKYLERKQSNAHYLFFNKIFKFKGFRIMFPDEYDDIQMETYKQNKI